MNSLLGAYADQKSSSSDEESTNHEPAKELEMAVEASNSAENSSELNQPSVSLTVFNLRLSDSDFISKLIYPWLLAFGSQTDFITLKTKTKRSVKL
jgi:hypothetical protein